MSGKPGEAILASNMAAQRLYSRSMVYERIGDSKASVPLAMMKSMYSRVLGIIDQK